MTMSLSIKRSRYQRTSVIIKAFIMLMILLLVALVAFRIWVVNARAFNYPERHCQIGETVDLSGTFYDAYEGEGDENHGYSVKVDGVEVLSPNEFLARYAADDKSPVIDGDVKSIVNVTCTFTNKGNTDGGLWIFKYLLVPSSMNSAWSYDAELWERAYPFMAGQTSFSLEEGTTFTMQVPFYLEKRADYFSSYDETGRVPVTDDSYQLLLCNAPERTWVDLPL